MFYWYFPLNSGFIPEGTTDLTSYVKDVGIHFGNKKVYILNNVILLLWLIHGNSWIEICRPDTIPWRPQHTFLRENVILSLFIWLQYSYLSVLQFCSFLIHRRNLVRFPLFTYLPPRPPTPPILFRKIIIILANFCSFGY